MGFELVKGVCKGTNLASCLLAQKIMIVFKYCTNYNGERQQESKIYTERNIGIGVCVGVGGV